MKVFTHHQRGKTILTALAAVLLSPLAGMAQTPVNDLCGAATSISSHPTCTPTAGTLYMATPTAGMPTGCGNANSADVWYSFTAQSTNPNITLTVTGGSLTNTRVQVLTLPSGVCPTNFVQTVCNTNPTAGFNLTGLTIGTTYYVRVTTNNNTGTIVTGTAADWGFTICVRDPAPGNNACGSATTLTSSLSCASPTTGTIYASTLDGTSTACGTPTYDVWYQFVAQTTSPTITLGSIGASFTNPGMELFSGGCGTLVPITCGTTSINTTLTVGTTYRIRVFSNGGTAPTTSANTGFTICVTDPPPGNDVCTNARTLTSLTTCVTGTSRLTGQTLKHADATAGITPCGAGNDASADVWYSFVAQSNYPSITLSNIGGDLRNAARGNGTMIQLFSGSCAGLTSLGCATSAATITSNTFSTAAIIGGAGLVKGNTYFIRIATNNNSTNTATGTGWGFDICVTDPVKPRYGNSYVNVSKRTTGGVVQPGDTLEIRMTIHYTSGTLYQARYVDNVPTNTQMLAGPDDSIRVLTNEGLTYYHFTPTAGDDPATYVASPGPGEYNVKLNLGFAGSSPSAPADNTETNVVGSGEMLGSNRPRGGSGLLFATSFRVRVTGTAGSVITLGSGKFLFRYANGGVDSSLSTTPYQILISNPQDLCANATGVNSAQEFGGTFGSGTTLNRPTNLTFPIPSYQYVNASTTQAVGDGQYAIVKNSSPREGTNQQAMRQPVCTGTVPTADSCFNRMFNGHWFIDGDHTGTNNSIGNLPPAPGVNGGYMLMVNADYVSSETYRQTISGLCPNTYYEFSAWIKNICPNCGVDSTGTSTYRPGVYPNLTFVMDGVDRYSTGEVDTMWVKKGFLFTTGPSQTSATFSIRNNGQGGGGNDWVMDDISIATCLPNMTYTPTLNPNVCVGNPITINNTIGSYFDNYRYHQWQQSTDNGATWFDIGPIRDSTPVFNPGTNSYEYLTSYTVPPTSMSDSGNRYRVLVATSSANLANPDCRVTDGVSFINLNVLDCGPVLSTELLSFSGKLIAEKARLTWTSSREEGQVSYTVERSNDGRIFNPIGQVAGYNNGGSPNTYYFDDPNGLNPKAFYRVVLNKSGGSRKFSAIIELRKDMPDFGFGNVINPFSNSLRFDIAVSTATTLRIELIDMNGRVVKSKKQLAAAGMNSLLIADTYGLASGLYTLRVINNGTVLTKRVMKSN